MASLLSAVGHISRLLFFLGYRMTVAGIAARLQLASPRLCNARRGGHSPRGCIRPANHCGVRPGARIGTYLQPAASSSQSLSLNGSDKREQCKASLLFDVFRFYGWLNN
jgi:hypothetical protein